LINKEKLTGKKNGTMGDGQTNNIGMATFFKQMHCNENQQYSVVVEDDGEVAYAYLLDGEEIVGDVWLYNNGEAPATFPWKEGKKMPFTNPKVFLKENMHLLPIENNDEVSVIWSNYGNGAEAIVTIRGEIIAKLQSGSKPGWSKLVVKEGPLAKVFHE
jgi:hypothetical protein